MKARTAYDVMGTNEIIIRCRCEESAQLLVVSLSAFMKMGRARALDLAEGLCDTCRTKAAT